MDIKEVNHIIKEILCGNSIVNYEKFENVIELLGLYNIKIVPDAKFIITCDLPSNVSGRCCGVEWIKINKKAIRNIYYGNKIAMVTIFHELKHFRDNYNILNNIYDEETIRILKDNLINFEVNNFERKVLGGVVSYNCYYRDNYDVESSEVLAEKYAYLDMIKYFDFIGVKLSDSELSSISNNIHMLDKKYNKKLRNLTHCFMYNNFYLTVDEAFDIAIRDNLSWLEEYPCLKKEYYVDSKNKVRIIR